MRCIFFLFASVALATNDTSSDTSSTATAADTSPTATGTSPTATGTSPTAAANNATQTAASPTATAASPTSAKPAGTDGSPTATAASPTKAAGTDGSPTAGTDGSPTAGTDGSPTAGTDGSPKAGSPKTTATNATNATAAGTFVQNTESKLVNAITVSKAIVDSCKQSTATANCALLTNMAIVGTRIVGTAAMALKMCGAAKPTVSCFDRKPAAATGLFAIQYDATSKLFGKCARRRALAERRLSGTEATITDTVIFTEVRAAKMTAAEETARKAKLDVKITAADYAKAMADTVAAIKAGTGIPGGLTKDAALAGVAVTDLDAVPVNASSYKDVTPKSAFTVPSTAGTTSNAAVATLSGAALLGAALLF